MKIDESLSAMLKRGYLLCDDVEVISGGLQPMSGTVQYKTVVNVAPCVLVRLTNTIRLRHGSGGWGNWELKVTYTHPGTHHREFAKRANIMVDDLANWTEWSTKRALTDARATCRGHAVLRDTVYACADKVRRVQAELIGP